MVSFIVGLFAERSAPLKMVTFPVLLYLLFALYHFHINEKRKKRNPPPPPQNPETVALCPPKRKQKRRKVVNNKVSVRKRRSTPKEDKKQSKNGVLKPSKKDSLCRRDKEKKMSRGPSPPRMF
eukprot:Hpha_TRINITY_DN14661_c0_g1::TRINITY_DN14661_c0_g1_i1::g.48032::m.48032